MTNRVIALIDMDCFYAQVEQKLNRDIRGQPCAVVQYKVWKGGSIIAVNYEARAFGVNRNMHGDDAKRVCPNICLPRVPEVRGKADLTRYRDASKDVFNVLTQFSDKVEKASIDEAYIDLTSEIQQRFDDNNKRVISTTLESTHIVGFDKNNPEENRCEEIDRWLDEIYDETTPNIDDQRLAIAAELVENIRDEVYKQTSFHCSAGIAHNKVLAKLACGMNKPKKQTVVPQSSVPELYAKTDLKKVRNLGGKLGDSLTDELSCKTMSDLAKLSRRQLINHFGDKAGIWLFDLGRGIENEPVVPRQLVKSIGCSKNFFGKAALSNRNQVKHWVSQLATEVVERVSKDLEDNKRLAKLLTVSVRLGGGHELSHVSRSCAITVYDVVRISHDVLNLLEKLNTSSKENWFPPILSLGLSAGKFQDHVTGNMIDIKKFFKVSPSKINDASEKSERRSEKEIATATKTLPLDSTEMNNSASGSGVNTPVKKGFFASKMESIKAKANNPTLDGSSNMMEEIGREILHDISLNPEADVLKNCIEDVSKKSGIGKFFAASARLAEDATAKSSAISEESSMDSVLSDIDSVANQIDKQNSDTVACKDCGKDISVWEYDEHQDYHLALKVQTEWRQGETKPQTSKDSKRRAKKSKEIPNKKMKSIESFFCNK